MGEGCAWLMEKMGNIAVPRSVLSQDGRSSQPPRKTEPDESLAFHPHHPHQHHPLLLPLLLPLMVVGLRHGTPDLRPRTTILFVR